MRIHTYAAAEPGLFVNSYLLETDEAAVLVDASLLVSDARALAARIAALRKPLAGVFVTHAHPDHFNGLPFVAGEDVPVYATDAVSQTIARIADAKREQWQPMYGDEWPDRYRVPDHPLPGGGVVEMAGLRVEVRDLGVGESHADSFLVIDPGDQRVAFIGDVAFHGTHSYLSDGHSSEWLATLDRLVDDLAGARLYPGHGAPSGVELLADQRRYLLMYREVVRRLAGGTSALTPEQKPELSLVMQRFLPGAPLDWLIALGADPVAAELAEPAVSAPAG
jgi:glyoxylase-like metal-dependent hydrolase (beta-lactamase superfamily II)